MHWHAHSYILHFVYKNLKYDIKKSLKILYFYIRVPNIDVLHNSYALLIEHATTLVMCVIMSYINHRKKEQGWVGGSTLHRGTLLVLISGMVYVRYSFMSSIWLWSAGQLGFFLWCTVFNVYFSSCVHFSQFFAICYKMTWCLTYAFCTNACNSAWYVYVLSFCFMMW